MLREMTAAERRELAAFIAGRDRAQSWFFLSFTVFVDAIAVFMAISSARQDPYSALCIAVVALVATAGVLWFRRSLLLSGRVYPEPQVTRLRGIVTSRPGVEGDFDYWLGPYQLYVPRGFRRYCCAGAELEVDVARLLKRQTHEPALVVPLARPTILWLPPRK